MTSDEPMEPEAITEPTESEAITEPKDPPEGKWIYTAKLKTGFQAGIGTSLGLVGYGIKDFATGEVTSFPQLHNPTIGVSRYQFEGEFPPSYLCVSFATKEKGFSFNIGHEDAARLATMLAMHSLVLKLKQEQEEARAYEEQEQEDARAYEEQEQEDARAYEESLKLKAADRTQADAQVAKE
jgi:hypothetical protein